MSETPTGTPAPITGEAPIAVAAGVANEVAAPEAAKRDASIMRLTAALRIDDPASILRFGQEAQNRATSAADAMLEGARNREAGEAGETLASLLATLRGFDVASFGEKPGLFARLFRKAAAETHAVVTKYEDIRGQVESVGDRLDTHRTRLLEDVDSHEILVSSKSG